MYFIVMEIASKMNYIIYKKKKKTNSCCSE